MERANIENLIKKVETIAHGPHADLLEKFIDLLEREMEGPEYFSPEDLAAIEEGKAQNPGRQSRSWTESLRGGS